MLEAIASVVTAATLVLLTAFLIPAAIELKKAAAALRSVSVATEAQLEPLLSEMRAAVAEIRVVTSSAAANADGVHLLMEELEHAGENIHAINKAVGAISTLVSSSSAWAAGARVAGKFILDRLVFKRG